MSDHASPAPHDPYAAFRHRPFWIYLSSYVLAVISSAMLSFAAKFEVNELTRSSDRGPDYYLGLLGATGAIPIIFLSLFAGHVVDRFNRKAILLITQVVLSICPAVFAFLAWGGLHSVWTVYAIVLINGSTLAFARPARTALISSLVPRKDLSNAITWNSTFFETSAAIGPAFAGFTIAGAGLSIAMLICAAFMATCLLMSLALPNPATPSGEGRELLSWRSLMSGFRFVFNTRLLFAVMALDLFAVLFGGATYLMPRFADRLGVGAFGLGCMVAAPGVGAIAMALSQAHLPPFKRAGSAMLLAVITFGIATIAFGLSRSYYLSLAMLFVIGAADNVSVIVRHSLVQLLTPDSMRGRVSAVNQVFIGSSNEIGGFESGMTAKLFGSPVTSVVVGGAAVLAVVGVIAARFPEVRRLGRLHEVESAPPEPPEVTQSTMSVD
jgi:MFS family permease